MSQWWEQSGVCPHSEKQGSETPTEGMRGPLPPVSTRPPARWPAREGRQSPGQEAAVSVQREPRPGPTSEARL